jgi:hypothetical protein
MSRALTALIIGLVLAGDARAQRLRGVVRDSITQTPIGGAVVTLADAAGRPLARAISNENGIYFVSVAAAARTVNVLRIGFRPRTLPFAGGEKLDIAMSPIPPLLEPVTVRAGANCPRRRDRLQALSLLQQARAGLLATVTARQTNRATLVRLKFVRQMDEADRHIVKQRVALDSAGGLSESFGAVRSGAEFVAKGFVDRTRDDRIPTHYGPDAETLLDDAFAAGYCFQIGDRDRNRPNQIGLVFKPATRQRGRVDIDGTLWIDTVAKSLRDIQFTYVGDDVPRGAPRTGGHIEFRTMGNGIVIIDRWVLRLYGVRQDTTWEIGGYSVRPAFHYQDVGGEVASATWDDGFTWQASLGSLRALAVDYQNQAARGVVVRLEGTDYIASPNASGILEMPYLLPGPYVATVVDPVLERLGITLPTSLLFEAERDSVTQRSFSIPQREEFVLTSCLHANTSEAHPEPMRIRVIDPFGKPVAYAAVEISRDNGAPNQAVVESLDTDDNGVARSCLLFRDGDPFDVTVTRGENAPFKARYRYRDAAMTIRLKEKPSSS